MKDVDHDLFDGAPIVRLHKDLTKQIETGDSIN
jgi:hypothetical protein